MVIQVSSHSLMNGVTGRMGTNQHLLRSIAEITKQGGEKIGSDDTVIPDPILNDYSYSMFFPLYKLSMF